MTAPISIGTTELASAMSSSTGLAAASLTTADGQAWVVVRPDSPEAGPDQDRFMRGLDDAVPLEFDAATITR